MIPIHYACKDIGNFGDLLGPYIVETLTGKQTEWTHCGEPHLMACGSILADATEHSTVWGSGFISRDQTVTGKPAAVHAVRGPITAEMLRAQGLQCPDVYGDPALLLPLLYNPHSNSQNELPLWEHAPETLHIPHYADYDVVCNMIPVQDTAHEIWNTIVGIGNEKEPANEEKPANEEEQEPESEQERWGELLRLVRAIATGDMIETSSLHVMIVAHAYGKRVRWVSYGNRMTGDRMKFYDYFASVGIQSVYPVDGRVIRSKDDPSGIVPPGRFDSRPLLHAFPFDIVPEFAHILA